MLLLLLYIHQHHALLRNDELKCDVFGRPTRARLLGELLLIMVGELRSAPLVAAPLDHPSLALQFSRTRFAHEQPVGLDRARKVFNSDPLVGAVNALEIALR